MDWGFTIAVVITGIVVVFVVLSILVMLCSSMGAFFSTENQVTKVETIPVKQEIQSQEQPITAPIIEDGISQEVVAAISASLAVIMGEENTNYKITSVSKAKTTNNQNVKGFSRNAWATAGLAENTRPF